MQVQVSQMSKRNFVTTDPSSLLALKRTKATIYQENINSLNAFMTSKNMPTDFHNRAIFSVILHGNIASC